MMTGEREITAIHEAGHCLVAERLGFRVKKARIFPNNDENGITTFEFTSLFRRLIRLFSNPVEYGMTLKSGNAAQKHFFPDSKILPGDDRDLKNALWIKSIDINKTDQALQKILLDERNLAAIREIARTLNRDDSITGQKVREVIERIDSS